MSDTDLEEDDWKNEPPAPDPTLTSYAPGHGPDGPIEGWVPPAPPATSSALHERILDAIDTLNQILEQLP